MGSDESNEIENHPVLGNIKQALDTLVQQRYLQKDKVSGPEGNTFLYELAESASDAPFSESTKAHISEIYGGLALLGSRLWWISLEVGKLQVEMSQSSKKSQPEDFVSRITVGSVYICTASSR